ncbi:unnamed protein product [Amoebophrya sp. A120]|nr:unnamed protein product [Amoebophrya sp. A120]|eukprot:GSA120T00021549001.1
MRSGHRPKAKSTPVRDTPRSRRQVAKKQQRSPPAKEDALIGHTPEASKTVFVTESGKKRSAAADHHQIARDLVTKKLLEEEERKITLEHQQRQQEHQTRFVNIQPAARQPSFTFAKVPQFDFNVPRTFDTNKAFRSLPPAAPLVISNAGPIGLFYNDNDEPRVVRGKLRNPVERKEIQKEELQQNPTPRQVIKLKADVPSFLLEQRPSKLASFAEHRQQFDLKFQRSGLGSFTPRERKSEAQLYYEEQVREQQKRPKVKLPFNLLTQENVKLAGKEELQDRMEQKVESLRKTSANKVKADLSFVAVPRQIAGNIQSVPQEDLGLPRPQSYSPVGQAGAMNPSDSMSKSFNPPTRVSTVAPGLQQTQRKLEAPTVLAMQEIGTPRLSPIRGSPLRVSRISVNRLSLPNPVPAHSMMATKSLNNFIDDVAPYESVSNTEVISSTTYEGDEYEVKKIRIVNGKFRMDGVPGGAEKFLFSNAEEAALAKAAKDEKRRTRSSPRASGSRNKAEVLGEQAQGVVVPNQGRSSSSSAEMASSNRTMMSVSSRKSRYFTVVEPPMGMEITESGGLQAGPAAGVTRTTISAPAPSGPKQFVQGGMNKPQVKLSDLPEPVSPTQMAAAAQNAGHLQVVQPVLHPNKQPGAAVPAPNLPPQQPGTVQLSEFKIGPGSLDQQRQYLQMLSSTPRLMPPPMLMTNPPQLPLMMQELSDAGSPRRINELAEQIRDQGLEVVKSPRTLKNDSKDSAGNKTRDLPADIRLPPPAKQWVPAAETVMPVPKFSAGLAGSGNSFSTPSRATQSPESQAAQPRDHVLYQSPQEQQQQSQNPPPEDWQKALFSVQQQVQQMAAQVNALAILVPQTGSQAPSSAAAMYAEDGLRKPKFAYVEKGGILGAGKVPTLRDLEALQKAANPTTRSFRLKQPEGENAGDQAVAGTTKAVTIDTGADEADYAKGEISQAAVDVDDQLTGEDSESPTKPSDASKEPAVPAIEEEDEQTYQLPDNGGEAATAAAPKKKAAAKKAGAKKVASGKAAAPAAKKPPGSAEKAARKPSPGGVAAKGGPAGGAKEPLKVKTTPKKVAATAKTEAMKSLFYTEKVVSPQAHLFYNESLIESMIADVNSQAQHLNSTAINYTRKPPPGPSTTRELVSARSSASSTARPHVNCTLPAGIAREQQQTAGGPHSSTTEDEAAPWTVSEFKKAGVDSLRAHAAAILCERRMAEGPQFQNTKLAEAMKAAKQSVVAMIAGTGPAVATKNSASSSASEQGVEESAAVVSTPETAECVESRPAVLAVEEQKDCSGKNGAVEEPAAPIVFSASVKNEEMRMPRPEQPLGRSPDLLVADEQPQDAAKEEHTPGAAASASGVDVEPQQTHSASSISASQNNPSEVEEGTVATAVCSESELMQDGGTGAESGAAATKNISKKWLRGGPHSASEANLGSFEDAQSARTHRTEEDIPVESAAANEVQEQTLNVEATATEELFPSAPKAKPAWATRSSSSTSKKVDGQKDAPPSTTSSLQATVEIATEAIFQRAEDSVLMSSSFKEQEVVPHSKQLSTQSSQITIDLDHACASTFISSGSRNKAGLVVPGQGPPPVLPKQRRVKTASRVLATAIPKKRQTSIVKRTGTTAASVSEWPAESSGRTSRADSKNQK